MRKLAALCLVLFLSGCGGIKHIDKVLNSDAVDTVLAIELAEKYKDDPAGLTDLNKKISEWKSYAMLIQAKDAKELNKLILAHAKDLGIDASIRKKAYAVMIADALLQSSDLKIRNRAMEAFFTRISAAVDYSESFL